jgi:hypothetical protein
VVFGLGGIGLNVVQGARLVGANMIVGVDLNPDRKAIAERFGMTHFVNPSEVEGDIVSHLVDLTGGGADYSFECIGNTTTMRQALECCHKGWGESVIIGIAGAGQGDVPRIWQTGSRGFRGAAVGGDAPGTLVLLGNVGSSLWPAFSISPEYRDGRENPLDRWSRRVGHDLAARFDGQALFPFGGPPYQPFLRWAARAETVHGSTLGMLIHPRYGLWHAHRFALALPESLASPSELTCMGGRHPRRMKVTQHRAAVLPLTPSISSPGRGRSGAPAARSFTLKDCDSPCVACTAQPCLSACPVGAFTGTEYKVDRCVSYLAGDAVAACNQQGCQSRLACPVGAAHRYQPAQARFHMRAFVKAQLAARDGGL